MNSLMGVCEATQANPINGGSDGEVSDVSDILLNQMEAKEQICVALGLDPTRTTKVIIELDPQSIIQVHAVIAPDSEQLKKVSGLFRVNFVKQARVDDCHVVTMPMPPTSKRE
jgi:hypothetical protein